MAVETFCQYFQSALNFAGKQFKHLDLVLDTKTCTWFYIKTEGWQDLHRTATSFVDKLNNLICSEIAITQLTILGQSPSQISDCHLLLLHGRWEKKTSLVTASSPTFPTSNCPLASPANAAQCFSNDRFIYSLQMKQGQLELVIRITSKIENWYMDKYACTVGIFRIFGECSEC